MRNRASTAHYDGSTAQPFVIGHYDASERQTICKDVSVDIPSRAQTLPPPREGERPRESWLQQVPEQLWGGIRGSPVTLCAPEPNLLECRHSCRLTALVP